MCDFSGSLIAWIDGELGESESANLEQHVLACMECRSRVEAYRAVSSAFVAYCDAASPSKAPTQRRLSYWVPVLSGTAAIAALLLMFLRPALEPTPLPAPVATVPPAAVREAAPEMARGAARRHRIVPVQTAKTNWSQVDPDVQIIIPAEAMFPPGAVPEGVSFVADLSLAPDGSVEGLRLQP
jgi:anti-sigma factor RsiW